MSMKIHFKVKLKDEFKLSRVDSVFVRYILNSGVLVGVTSILPVASLVHVQASYGDHINGLATLGLSIIGLLFLRKGEKRNV